MWNEIKRRLTMSFENIVWFAFIETLEYSSERRCNDVAKEDRWDPIRKRQNSSCRIDNDSLIVAHTTKRICFKFKMIRFYGFQFLDCRCKQKTNKRDEKILHFDRSPICAKCIILALVCSLWSIFLFRSNESNRSISLFIISPIRISVTLTHWLYPTRKWLIKLHFATCCVSINQKQQEKNK